MRIRVSEVLSAGANPRVRFVMAFGASVALWHGEPPEQREYDVELEVPETLEWGRTILCVDAAAQPAISTVEAGVRICGTLDSVDEDGVIAVRLGPSIFLVETIGEMPAVGSRICLTTEGLELFPVGN